MPIEIQSTQSGPPNGLVQFTFANPVVQYAIGIRAFTMTYGADDHWIQSLAIKILPVQNASIGATSNQVSAHVQMTMQDSSGNRINVANSRIWPVCIAVTGSTEPNTVFGSAIGVSSGAPGTNVPMPPLGDGYKIATCFQSGFNLTFTSTDHQILQAHASLGFQAPQMSASAGMNDRSGNSVQVATVDAGYIASSYPTPGIVATPVSKQTGSPFPVSVTGAKAAVALIQSWTVEFPHVHNLKTVAVGSFGDPTCAGDVVTVQSCYAHMSDASGNNQDDDSSSCDLVIIAIT
jgi:hypothetical protein